MKNLIDRQHLGLLNLTYLPTHERRYRIRRQVFEFGGRILGHFTFVKLIQDCFMNIVSIIQQNVSTTSSINVVRCIIYIYLFMYYINFCKQWTCYLFIFVNLSFPEESFLCFTVTLPNRRRVQRCIKRQCCGVWNWNQ